MANKPDTTQLFLGIECGGTRTVALLADGHGQLVKRIEAGAANLRLLTDVQLPRHFKTIAREFPRPTALGIGMAGMRTEADRKRILAAAARVWPQIPCFATNDLETAFAAIPRHTSPATHVLVLSGTGSCCYGKNPVGKIVKVGGWGHILGDGGSGYKIALTTLEAVVSEFDRTGKLSPLGRRLLHALQLNEPDEFIAWAQAASKNEMAALAVEVFAAANSGDKIASAIMPLFVNSIAFAALNCARRLMTRPQEPVEFILAGSNLIKQPRFEKLVTARIKEFWPGAIVMPLKCESAWGAVELAREVRRSRKSEFHQSLSPNEKLGTRATRPSELSPTELRNPRSMNLDKLPTAKAIELMLSEDAKIPAALRAERRQIERTIELIVRAFRRGGKLFYVGAGTSGRLGILDASECPPTFRTPPEMVQGIIAGGQSAIWQAVEGAEDDAAAGARAVEFRGLGKHDVVVGIAASGRTPFVWGALKEAKRRGAKTVLLCFNPALKIPLAERPDIVIAPDIGPEILTGSTRLKAGTATKLVLNMFTTLAMVRLGKVVGNLMVDVNPSNVKLRDRAVRIVQELTGADEATACAALEKSGWVVKTALRKL